MQLTVESVFSVVGWNDASDTFKLILKIPGYGYREKDEMIHSISVRKCGSFRAKRLATETLRMDDLIKKLTAEQALEVVKRLSEKGGKIRRSGARRGEEPFDGGRRGSNSR